MQKTLDGDKADFVQTWILDRCARFPLEMTAEYVSREIVMASAAYDAIMAECIEEMEEEIPDESVSRH